MKSFKLNFAVLLISLGLVACEPPSPNYVHSSYDEISPQHSHHHHDHGDHHGGHSHGGGHASHAPRGHYHQQGQGGVEHEVIVQHHHYPPPPHHSRVITHGHPPESSHATPASSYKSRPRPHAPSHYYPGKTAASEVVKGDYHLPHTHASDYGSGKLNAGYASYKSNDYKAYAMITPSHQADDYGSTDAYSPPSSHASHASHSHASHSEYDSSPYDAAPAYNAPPKRPNSYTYSPPSASYGGSQPSLYGYAPYSPAAAHDHHDHSVRVRGKEKGYRSPSPSHSSSYSSPSSSYQYSSSGFYPPVSRPSTPYTPVSSSPVSPKGLYGSPKTAYGKPAPSYGIPTVKSYVPKTTYGLAYTNYEAPAKSYYRQPSKGYGPVPPASPSYNSYSPSSSSSSYGAPSASSYAYGSPSTKGFGYADSDKHSPSPHGNKGHVHFGSEDAYGGENYDEAEERNGPESYEAETDTDNEGDNNSNDGHNSDDTSSEGSQNEQHDQSSLEFPVTLQSNNNNRGDSRNPNSENSNSQMLQTHEVPPSPTSSSNIDPNQASLPYAPLLSRPSGQVSGPSSQYQPSHMSSNGGFHNSPMHQPHSNYNYNSNKPEPQNQNHQFSTTYNSPPSHKQSYPGSPSASQFDPTGMETHQIFSNIMGHPNDIPPPSSKPYELEQNLVPPPTPRPSTNNNPVHPIPSPKNSPPPSNPPKAPKKILIKILVGPKSRVAISNSDDEGEEEQSSDVKR